MLLQIIGSFLAVVSFCVLLGAPRKYLPYAGIIGALGWALFILLQEYSFSMGSATFFSGCLICLCSQFLARLLKTPVTVFVISGILPLVPGAGMYHIAFSIMHSNSVMTSYYVTQTLTVAGMIAVSIIVVDSIFKLIPWRSKQTGNKI